LKTEKDIAAVFKEMYSADVSHTLISRVTDAVIDEVQAWQESPLDDLYPILYLDGIVVKVHQDKRVINKTVFGFRGQLRETEDTLGSLAPLRMKGPSSGYPFSPS